MFDNSGQKVDVPVAGWPTAPKTPGGRQKGHLGGGGISAAPVAGAGAQMDCKAAALDQLADQPAALNEVERSLPLTGNHRITLGADKAYDVAEFVPDLRGYNVTPHVSQNISNRRSAIDGRTTRHPGYAVSVRVFPRNPEHFADGVPIDPRLGARSSPRPTLSTR